MLVKIYKLGEDELVNTFRMGAHVLGRGPVLQCNDKRISRNHATIEITQDDVKLTSTHVNPCFLRASNSKTITILSNNSSTQLHNGDSFAFLPDDYWFTLKFEQNDEETGVKSPEVRKRPSLSCDDEEVPPDKRARFEESDGNINDTLDNVDAEHEENGANVSENMINEATSTKRETNDSNEHGDVVTTQEPDQTVTETVAEPDLVGEDISVTKEEEDDAKEDQAGNEPAVDVTDADGNGPSGSAPKPKRERCFYGAQCYRKNPLHRLDFTHPGDSDYESDPDDNRPACGYGADCYRKNKDHRRNFKHPPKQAPGKKKRNRKKVQRLNVADSEEMREFDSEEEDPFVVDDDSDEYVGESDDDDSDWEESQDADEDSQNIKRLVKEANRFVKK